jgi:hypothetical protein
MSPSPSRVSGRLKRAVAAERGRLAEQRERIERARSGVRGELDRLERELAEIDWRLELLVRLAPAPEAAGRLQPDGNCDQGQSRGEPRGLRGPAIRIEAVRLLAGRVPAVEAIHYRDWYRLLEARGFAVSGKKPLAVFLTQVSRSPVVRKAMSPGVYELDRGALERLRDELAALEADLQALSRQRPDARNGELHARRRALVQAIGRHEHALEEALHSLLPGDDSADSPTPRLPAERP